MSTATTLVAEPELTAFDRCDRCGAQAYAVFVKTTALLSMCKHHADEHEDALTTKGFVVTIDERHLLFTAQPEEG